MGKSSETIIICVAGAAVGLIIAVFANWLVLPMVLRAQERKLRDDAPRMRALTIAAYRYAMPLVFGGVGAAAAYYLFVADAP